MNENSVNRALGEPDERLRFLESKIDNFEGGS